MAYMSRLGIWGTGTQFNTFGDFIKSVERRYVGMSGCIASIIIIIIFPFVAELVPWRLLPWI